MGGFERGKELLRWVGDGRKGKFGNLVSLLPSIGNVHFKLSVCIMYE